jgi:ChrR Cupin-like domain
MDQSKIAYQKPPPAGMVPDVFVGSALELDGDKGEWVPQSDAVAFRPLVLNVSQGYYINILRVRSSGVLSRHRHSGPVHAFTLRGRWGYLEHDWIATPGDYAFEPPDETHTGRSGRRQGNGRALSRDRRVHLRRSPGRGARIRRRFHQVGARDQALRSRRVRQGPREEDRPMTRRETVDVGGVPISYLTTRESGPLLLLLHGTYWSRV